MTLSRPSIALVIPSLEGGGAQQMLIRLAAHWCRNGHDVTVLTLASTDVDQFELPEEVRRIGLDLVGDSKGLWMAIQENRQRVRALRDAIRQCRATCVVSFIDQTNVLSLLACRPLDVDVIIAERTDPRYHRLNRAWRWLRRWTYPRCRAAVAQTESVGGWLAQVVRGKPIHVIPNGAPACELDPEAREDPASHNRTLIAVGRLSPEKGLDVLIEGFAQIADAFPMWGLCIVGDGPERERLEVLAEKLVPGRVQWTGWVNDPRTHLAASDLFALTSHYEGFPNALLEAMACGLPAVSFDCDSGPSEIIRHEIDGLLVPAGDQAAFVAALRRCCGDDAFRAQLAERAVEVQERFSERQMLARWDALLADCRRA